MNIDWSKAPEGAEYWCELQWFKILDGEWRVWCPGVNSWLEPAYADPDNFSWWGNAIKRPSVWNGEGLPPVGAVCECMCTAKGKERDWFVARVNYMSEHTAVLDSLVDCAEIGEFVAHPGTVKFRPLRTPELIAAEEREKAITELAAELAGHWSAEAVATQRDMAAYLYDAGYRKQEQTK